MPRKRRRSSTAEKSAATDRSGGPIIAVIGGLNMDMVMEAEHIPDLGEFIDGSSFTTMPGGTGANIAIASYRASHYRPSKGRPKKRRRSVKKKEGQEEAVRVFMNGAVGDDDFGSVLRTRLEDGGVDVTGVRIIEGEKSGTCLAVLDKKTRESRNLAYQGANLSFSPRQSDSVECFAAGVAMPDLIITHLGMDRDMVERLLKTAAKNGTETILKPSPAKYLITEAYKNVTHLIMNEKLSATLTPDATDNSSGPKAWKKRAEYFLESGVKNVIITTGAQGAYYATHDGMKGLVSAEKNVKVEDTNGAGDSFIGAYAVENVRQKRQGSWDIHTAIARACRASARTIERLGVQQSIPWSDEIDED